MSVSATEELSEVKRSGVLVAVTEISNKLLLYSLLTWCHYFAADSYFIQK